ncbi:hypothetical protein LC607_03295 [Nostoc sp. CHAB 5824]|nr:hypothetical protein [Nostoc sp. CHAB 5824]
MISLKHGGATTPDNLCYACIFCNLQKRTDLESIIINYLYQFPFL